MVDHEDQIGFFVVLMILITLVVGVRKYLQYKKKMFKMSVQERYVANQQEDIYNISSRVQGQGQGQGQWPTHDGHVSMDHFAITNELNKYNDAPPSYDEAMAIAIANSTSTTEVPAVVPKATTTSTTSVTTTTTSTAATTVTITN